MEKTINKFLRQGGKKAQKNRLKSINLKFEDTMFPIARAETNRKLHDIAL